MYRYDVRTLALFCVGLKHAANRLYIIQARIIEVFTVE